MSAREIPDAAVEAAARAMWNGVRGDHIAWEAAREDTREMWRRHARLGISAALPFLGGIEEVRADEVRVGDEVWIGSTWQRTASVVALLATSGPVVHAIEVDFESDLLVPTRFHADQPLVVRRSSSTGEEPVGPFSGVTDEALLDMGRSSLGHGAPTGEEQA